MSDSLPPKEAMCHCTGFEKSCRDLVYTGACTRWRGVEVIDRNTKAKSFEWDCIDNLEHRLLLDIGQGITEATASVDSHRNQMIKIGRRQIEQRDQALKLLPGAKPL